MSSSRQYTAADHLLINLDLTLRTLLGRPRITERADPAAAVPEAALDDEQRRLAGRLMRINHAGEVSAQGLYQGQALTARLPQVREKMERAAQEESDHLDWCERRARQLGTHVSYLNPLWYAGSLAIGACAGLAGDQWSLGFVVETERQVVKHLDDHLTRLPAPDRKSRAILEQMKIDEARHATTAMHAGAAELPGPMRMLMTFTSRIMTRTAYWL